MNETAFETIAQAAAVLKLDFSSEEFAGFAEDHTLISTVTAMNFRTSTTDSSYLTAMCSCLTVINLMIFSIRTKIWISSKEVS